MVPNQPAIAAIVNETRENVLFCRFCGHLSPVPEAADAPPASARCARCGAYSGLEAVAEADARERSRRVRLEFLRSRLVRLAIVVLPLVGVAIWVLWSYTGLPPDPPAPSTRIGDTGVAAATNDWPQAARGETNLASGSVLNLPDGTAPAPAWHHIAGAPIVAPPAVSGDRV